MKITLLAQGSTPQERAREYWGIAFLVGREILFDTFGDARVLLRNIKKQKVNLAHIKHIVISHDHWDHTNGLWSILPHCPQACVYVCQRTSIALKKKIRSFGVKLVNVEKPMGIIKGVHTTGQLKGRLGAKTLYEQSLVLSSAKGLVLLTGCSHPGIVRIVDRACTYFQQPVLWAIGGFHLKDADPKEIEHIALRLKELGVQKVVPLHCTGRVAQGIFKNVFGQECTTLKIGKPLFFDR